MPWWRQKLTVLLVSALVIPSSAAPLTIAPEAEPEPSYNAASRPAISLWDEPAPAPPIEVKPVVAQPAETERAKSANPLWAIPLTTLSNTRERPIFSASRRPPPASAPVAVAEAPPAPPKLRGVERPQLSLVGTVIGTDESFGIFIDPEAKTSLRLRLGEDFQGWRLRSVQSRDVMLERGQQSAILSLPEPANAVAPPVFIQAQSSAAQTIVEPPPRGGPR